MKKIFVALVFSVSIFSTAAFSSSIICETEDGSQKLTITEVGASEMEVSFAGKFSGKLDWVSLESDKDTVFNVNLFAGAAPCGTAKLTMIDGGPTMDVQIDAGPKVRYGCYNPDAQ